MQQLCASSFDICDFLDDWLFESVIPSSHADHRFKNMKKFRAFNCWRFDSLVVLSHHWHACVVGWIVDEHLEKQYIYEDVLAIPFLQMYSLILGKQSYYLMRRVGERWKMQNLVSPHWLVSYCKNEIGWLKRYQQKWKGTSNRPTLRPGIKKS